MPCSGGVRSGAGTKNSNERHGKPGNNQFATGMQTLGSFFGGTQRPGDSSARLQENQEDTNPLEEYEQMEDDGDFLGTTTVLGGDSNTSTRATTSGEVEEGPNDKQNGNTCNKKAAIRQDPVLNDPNMSSDNEQMEDDGDFLCNTTVLLGGDSSTRATTSGEAGEGPNDEQNGNTCNEEAAIRQEPALKNPDMSSARMNGRSVSGIVKTQLAVIRQNNKNRPNDIRKKVRLGRTWDKRGVLLHNHIAPNRMKTGWQCFFEMDVYHWLPSILLERGRELWYPLCPNKDCQKQCFKNGFNKPPRIVYGMHECYILNGPERYVCKSCRSRSQEQKRNGVRKNQLIPYERNCLDKDIMQQIQEINPGIFYEFPCVLTHINAVDKSVLKLVQDLAVRGLGPTAAADMMLSWHEHTWQVKEIKWLSHLASRMENPVVGIIGHDSNLQSVDKCPSYFSQECCGATPSSKYLVSIFNKSINENRPYYDGEVVEDVLFRLYCEKWDIIYPNQTTSGAAPHSHQERICQ